MMANPPDELFDAVKIYNTIPSGHEAEYCEAILCAYAAYVQSQGTR